MGIWNARAVAELDATLPASAFGLHELGRRLAWTPEAAWEWITRLQQRTGPSRTDAPRARGAVATPTETAARMSRALLAGWSPGSTLRVLDAGCGDGRLLAAVAREASRRRIRVACEGVEIDATTARWAQALLPLAQAGAGPHLESWRIRRLDFLRDGVGRDFDAVIANPPYVPWRDLDTASRERLRVKYRCAPGDLAALFLERMLDLVRPGGRLCVIVPNKLLATRYATPLRRRLAAETTLEEIWDLSGVRVFPDHASYPVVLVVRRRAAPARATIRVRDAKGSVRARWRQHAWASLPGAVVPLGLDPELGELALVLLSGRKLGDVVRVRCGIATSGFGRAVGHGSERILRSGDVRPFRLREAARFAPRQAGLDPAALGRMRGPKVVVPGMFRRLCAAYDAGGHVLGRVYYVGLSGRREDQEAERTLLLGLLNSSLYGLLYAGLYGAVAQSGGYTRLNAPYLASLPWPQHAPGPGLGAAVRACESDPRDPAARERLDEQVERLFGLGRPERLKLAGLARALPSAW